MGEEPVGLNPFEREEEEEGRQSAIYDYCKEAQKQGHVDCIWICMRRRSKWIAKDIRLGNPQFPISVHGLQKIGSWWKQHLFYSAVGVKEVMIRFMSYDASKNEIGVVVTDFDYDELQNDLGESIKALEHEVEPFECGVSILEEDSCARESYCPNMFENGIDSPYCVARHVRDLSMRTKNYKFFPSMLEYYWQNCIEDKAVKFLRNSTFVTTYKDLATDKYLDAANPYGKKQSMALRSSKVGIFATCSSYSQAAFYAVSPLLQLQPLCARASKQA